MQGSIVIDSSVLHLLLSSSYVYIIMSFSIFLICMSLNTIGHFSGSNSPGNYYVLASHSPLELVVHFILMGGILNSRQSVLTHHPYFRLKPMMSLASAEARSASL